jgi:DNA-binding response OmpR family regulator
VLPDGDKHRRGGGLRILLVDDEPSIRLAFATLLSRDGYVVDVAACGEAAERVLGERRIDCLILDYRIPDVRGDLLFEYAHSVQPHLKERTIFITGDIAASTHATLQTTGCPVLLKPFDIEDLTSAVRLVCAEADGRSRPA